MCVCGCVCVCGWVCVCGCVGIIITIAYISRQSIEYLCLDNQHSYIPNKQTVPKAPNLLLSPVLYKKKWWNLVNTNTLKLQRSRIIMTIKVSTKIIISKSYDYTVTTYCVAVVVFLASNPPPLLLFSCLQYPPCHFYGQTHEPHRSSVP